MQAMLTNNLASLPGKHGQGSLITVGDPPVLPSPINDKQSILFSFVAYQRHEHMVSIDPLHHSTNQGRQ